jgi:hypothetical protein
MITTKNIPNSTRRFGIEEKVDAWNARFIQGKRILMHGNKIMKLEDVYWQVFGQRGSSKKNGM